MNWGCFIYLMTLRERLKITSHFRFVVTTLVVMMTKVITTNLFLDDYSGF